MGIEPYRRAHQKAVLELFIEDGIDSLALYAAVTSCPIWAIYSFVIEGFPDNEEARNRLKSCMDFYGIV